MRHPTGKSHLWAILAHPVAHVRASEFLNPLIERAGRDAFLVPFHVLPEDLEATVRALHKVRNLRGLIVTIPHKPAMAAMCDELGPTARLTGTANTVRVEEDGRLVGEMFDGVGLVEAAKANGMPPGGKRVLLLGAGGAGRAIAFALAEAGVAALTIANRARDRAEGLAAAVRKAFPDVPVAAGPADTRGHDLIVNATSLGLKPGDPMPLGPAGLEAGMQLFDIIAPRDTELMEEARRRGLAVVGGRPMVEHQAKAQIEFLRPPALPA
jgi:shikimate dehydrogenase